MRGNDVFLDSHYTENHLEVQAVLLVMPGLHIHMDCQEIVHPILQLPNV